uniref:Death domain-containing protein n=1 Tax=Branchiostoma floridae TaxID=7739 RepID=C3YHT4_BRAFL|eukprot:XP_002604060.1 hypothetical protein BRAFLDRAFT_71650 [Branchiostoma floridae]
MPVQKKRTGWNPWYMVTSAGLDLVGYKVRRRSFRPQFSLLNLLISNTCPYQGGNRYRQANMDDSDFLCAAAKGDVEKVRRGLEEGLDVNTKDYNNKRPVDVAAGLGRDTQLLLETETRKQAEYSELVSSVGSEEGTTVKLFLCGDGQVGKTSLRVILKKINGWLSFIHCSNADPTNKPRIVLIASHADKLQDQEAGWRRAKALVEHYRKLFQESLIVSQEVFLINCLQAGSPEIRRLREVLGTFRNDMLKQRPQVPKVCVEMLTLIESRRRERKIFPVMEWQDFLTAVRQATYGTIESRIVHLASSYLHDEGEIIYLSRKADSLVVLDPQWLFTSVFGALLAPDNFPIDKIARTADDCVTVEELTRVFGAVADIPLLIKLLQDFQLCHTYDGRIFILPSLLQQEMEEAAWSPVSSKSVYFGLQIRGRTEIDSFSCDLFPRLQTLLMQAHPDKFSWPRLWKNSAKCTDGKAEALLQITQDKRQLNIFVRSNDGSREDCNSIMDLLMDMTYRLLHETSPGARSRDMVLSALDLREHRPQPHAYSREEVEAAASKGENLVHPKRNVPEMVKDLLLHLRKVKVAWCIPIVAEMIPPWRELGINLGLSESDMEQISQRHQDDAESCCLAVLEEWLHLARTNATVEGLKTALGLAGQREIVEKLDTMEQSMSKQLLELQSEVTDIVHANFPNLNFVPDKNKEADDRRIELNRRTLREEVFSHSFNFSLDSVILDRIQERKKSVCRINWPGGSGTGFLLNKGKVLTCYHVYRWMSRALWSVHEASQYIATFFVSGEREYKVPFESPASLLKCYSEDLDYAILQLAVEDEMGRSLESLPLLGHFISESEDSRNMVVLVGHPSGGNKMVDFALIAGVAQRYVIHIRYPYMIQEDERKPIYDTSVMFHGSSGSPGFDTYGNVVLMHTRGFMDDGGQSVIERGVRLSAIRDHARQNLAPEAFSEIFPASFEQLAVSLPSFSIS